MVKTSAKKGSKRVNTPTPAAPIPAEPAETKPVAPAATTAANFRFPAALVKALDEWAKELNEGNPLGRQWTRTDIVQESLAYAVRTWGTRGLPPGGSSDAE
jgi:hypothetical protein